MERAEAGFKGILKKGVRRLLFPGEPKKSAETKEGKISVMFHLHLGKPDQVKPGLLPDETMKEIRNTFRQATGYSLIYASRKHYYLDPYDKFVLWKTGRMVNNYAYLQPFLEQGCQIEAVGSGDSAICSGLAAEAISLKAALGLTAIKARSIALAHSMQGGGIFSNPEIPFRTPKMEPFLEEFNDLLAGTDISEPKYKVVGDRGNIITTAEGMRAEIAQHPLEPINEEVVRRALRRLASPVQEIGLDSVDNTKKYLTIGSAAIGTAGVLTILAVIVHNKRQKSKKA